jgi:hypothetical protein
MVKPFQDNLNITDKITVEAWIDSKDSNSREGLQPVVSKWAIASTFNAFEAYDAGNTSGLNTVGYNGGAFDGRYIYFAPWRDSEELRHGRVLRYDTTGHNGSFILKYTDYGHNGGLCGALPGPVLL